MAMQFFKDIVNTKGYRIDAKDRKIFETGDLQSFFGLSDMDAIEFVLYDANDNQLPQGAYGLVRYITLTTQNISDYFLVADGTIFQAHKFPTEYFIDAERLINEAGYNAGIFKTQITLINKRLGTEEPNRKVWISEISPSRTEIRILPLISAENNQTDLYERFSVFLKDGEFRDDTLIYILNFIEQINPLIVETTIKSKYTEAWYTELCTEYKISDFSQLTTIIYNKFMESALYEITNRISDIRDLNYGKPKNTKPSLQLSKIELKNTYIQLLITAIDFYLAHPHIRATADFINTLDVSDDPRFRVVNGTITEAPYQATPLVIATTHKVAENVSNEFVKLTYDCAKEIEHIVTSSKHIIVEHTEPTGSNYKPVIHKVPKDTLLHIPFCQPSIYGEDSVWANTTAVTTTTIILNSNPTILSLNLPNYQYQYQNNY